MTTFRTAVLMLVAGAVWAQTPTPAPTATPAPGTTPAPAAAATPAPTAAPQDMTWALSEFSGGEWAARLPLLLSRGWDRLPDHVVTDAERVVFSQRAVRDAVTALRKQASQMRLDLDKKKIVGPLPAGEPTATEKALADLDTKITQTLAGTGVAVPPDTMNLRPVWPAGRDQLPWPAADGPTLAAQAKALLAVTGTVQVIGGYLEVSVGLYSSVENRVLATWQGRFSPDEAPQHMAEASDAFREALLGRQWAGLKLTSNLGGTRVRVGDDWHDLPWNSDDLSPGDVSLLVEPPGLPKETRVVTLQASNRTTLDLTMSNQPDRIVLETNPPGASLYMDSRYLGPSPQTVDRPLSVTRIRAQAPGLATTSWEIGPQTPSPSIMVLLPPGPEVSVQDAKDRFYWSLAVFSASLTSSAFLGAWSQEQANLTTEYANNASTSAGVANYHKALDRYWAVTYAYAGGVVLTSAVFVWMMFELGAYLSADESTLP
jgi:hypothetical protein